MRCTPTAHFDMIHELILSISDANSFGPRILSMECSSSIESTVTTTSFVIFSIAMGRYRSSNSA